MSEVPEMAKGGSPAAGPAWPVRASTCMRSEPGQLSRSTSGARLRRGASRRPWLGWRPPGWGDPRSIVTDSGRILAWDASPL